jgi:hypothetical protein
MNTDFQCIYSLVTLLVFTITFLILLLLNLNVIKIDPDNIFIFVNIIILIGYILYSIVTFYISINKNREKDSIINGVAALLSIVIIIYYAYKLLNAP